MERKRTLAGKAFYSVVFAAAVGAMALLMPACSGGDKSEKPEKPTAGEQTAGETGAASAQELWRKCSMCHERSRLKGKTAAHIQAAIDGIPVMSKFASELSTEDLATLESFLAPTDEPIKQTRYEFIATEVCATCHGEHREEWRHSMHALAHTDPVYNYYFVKASQESGGELEEFCARCHTPIAVYNGNIPFKTPPQGPGDTAVSSIETDGIQCDFCHVVKGYEKVKDGAYVMDPSPVKYGPFGDSVTTFHDTKFSALHMSPELCGICHDLDHPTNGLPLMKTFTEWKDSKYAPEGTTCQDCHMTLGLDHREEHPGRASTRGLSPERPHISKHYFVGPNMLFANSPDAERKRELSAELLRRAATLEIGDVTETQRGLEIEMKITNVGAGHYLPTGVSELREVWVAFTVTDKNGEIVYSAGDVDFFGNFERTPVVYRVDVADANGQMTTKFWNAERKVRDLRIAPGATVVQKARARDVTLQKGLTIKASLMYRSISPFGLAEVGAPVDFVSFKPFTMATAEKEL